MPPWLIGLLVVGGVFLAASSSEASGAPPAGSGPPPLPDPGDGGWTPPLSRPVVPGGRLLQAFRPNHNHYGVDISAPTGTPVHAAASGTVAGAFNDGQLQRSGITVSLRHDDGHTATLYEHLSNYTVQRGQRVEQGTLIGHVGSTNSVPGGHTTTPHLHMEVLQLRSARDAEHFTGTVPPRLDPVTWAREHGVALFGSG